MSSTKVSESGSSRMPKSTCSASTPIQVPRLSSRTRSSAGRARDWTNSATPRPNAPSTVAQPSRCPQRSVRRPPTSSTSAPNAGSATSSQAYWPSSSTGSTSTRSPSVLQQVCVVDGGRAAGPEDQHDDGEADHDLGCGDDHDEERHDLPVQGAVDASEGDQGEVHRVE